VIVVVGGGITGLALGRELAARGAEVQVLEARSEPGGVIRSGRVEGHLLEWGPQRTRLTAELRALVGALGLESEVLTPPPGLELFVYRDGRLRPVPFTMAGMACTDLLSWRGKARLLAEPFTAGADPDETVARYLTRKLGREAYLHLVGPLYGGLYGSDPADMVMRLSLGEVLDHFGVGRSLLVHLLRKGGRIDPPEACSFRDGMQTLPHALAHELGDRLRLDTPVRALHRRGEGWDVVTDRGTRAAEHVVLTVPAPVTARLLEGEAPGVSKRISNLTYNPLAVVHLHAETTLQGLGFQVSLAEQMALRGVTFNDSLFGRTGVYTAYLGGARHPDLVRRDDEALRRLAVEQFRRTTGFDARPLAVEREAMPAWDRSWGALRGLALPTGLHLATNWTGRPGIPGRLADAKRLATRLAARAPAPALHSATR
jgi:protoporphyrinogen/coproporphyrinogen III oxidase